MIPWIIFAVVLVPLLVAGFAATRRRTVAGERPASEAELTERQFEEAEAYEEKWQQEDKERYHQERLP